MAHTLYRLDVRVRDITPPIWRTIELGGATTLEGLHFAIQSAMGWTNSHLHQFVIGAKSYGMADIDEALELEDERAVRLQDAIKEGDRIVYEYDFGDGWEHDVTATSVSTVAKAPRPKCVDGQRACPPEDCGGPGGYEELVDALADRSHPRHLELREWSGDFQPEAFELPKGGRDLQREMTQLKALFEGGDDDADQDAGIDAMGIPRPLVEALLALAPMQRATIAALIVGSLGEELAEAQARARAPARQHKPTRASRKRGR